jgi:two-component sensor histidine kinase
VGINPRYPDQTGWASIKQISYNENQNELIVLSPTEGVALVDILADSLYFDPLNSVPGLNIENVIAIETSGNYYILSTTDKLYLISIIRGNKKKSPQIRIEKIIANVGSSLVKKTSKGNFIFLDTDNNLNTLQITETGSIKKSLLFSLKTFLPQGSETFSIEKFDNCFYIGGSNGLLQVRESPGGPDTYWVKTGAVIYFLHESAGKLWIAADNGLFCLENGRNALITVHNNSTDPNQDLLKNIFYLFSEEKDYLWIGSQNGLALLEKKSSPFFRITNSTDHNKPLKNVYNLNGGPSNTVLVSTENGLFSFNNGNNVRTIFDDTTYFLCFRGPANRQLISDLYSTWVITNNNKLIDYREIFPAFKSFPPLSFNDIEYLEDSACILSSENNSGVYFWNFKKNSVRRIESNDIIGQTNGLYKYENDVFILTDTAIFKLDVTTLQVSKNYILDKNNHSKYGLFFDMVGIPGGYLIASYGNGLLKTDKKFNLLNITSEKNGLSNNCTYRLIKIGDSLIYASTNNGLNLINLLTKSITHLGEKDGLHGNSFEEMSSLRINNLLYFGGKGGLTVIDTEIPYAPNNSEHLNFISFKQINSRNEVSELSLLEKNVIRIEKNIIQTTINFQNISFPAGKNNRYAYKIEEIDPNWIDIGNQNFISLTGLNPGTYHLKITLYKDDQFSAETKELVLIFLPKWYQTWWFKSLIVLTIALIALGLFRFRINQLKKEERIRNEIAVDLHDELGSTLSSVSMYSMLAGQQSKETTIKPYLQRISENTQIAIRDLKDIIWILDDKRNSVHDLLAKLRQFFQPLCESQGISYSQIAEDDILQKTLGKDEKRNLYLIIKEWMNNSLKYSGCKNLELGLKQSKGKKTIVISDDGKGFEKETIQAGKGLISLQIRTKKIGYTYTIHSSAGEGTRIELQQS